MMLQMNGMGIGVVKKKKSRLGVVRSLGSGIEVRLIHVRVTAHFNTIQDDTYTRRKAHVRSTPSIRSLASVPLKQLQPVSD